MRLNSQIYKIKKPEAEVELSPQVAGTAQPSSKNIKKKTADLPTGGLIPPAKQTGITAEERTMKFRFFTHCELGM